MEIDQLSQKNALKIAHDWHGTMRESMLFIIWKLTLTIMQS